tara:strand:+ start:1795 stop:2298 length:504 start_codon:yes stop_codon:yes gene_type:complete
MDDTLRSVVGFADRVITAGKNCKDFAMLRNYAQSQVNTDADWCLHADADELWPEQLLGRLEELLSEYPETSAFRFPRNNIEEPNQKVPDYQIRLVKRSVAKWRNKVHEIPFHREKDRALGLIGPPDCQTLDEYIITHMKRDKKIRDDIQVRWNKVAKPKKQKERETQ